MARDTPRRRQAVQHAQPLSDGIRRRNPITLDRIVDAGLKVVAENGYRALTIRAVATALETGPSSLYAHIVNKADLDDLLIGHLHAQISLPVPNAANWRPQIWDVCVQLRDQYLGYPGISQAALATVSSDAATLRVSEVMLAILITGGVPPAAAAWAIDALALYVAGYALEISLVQQRRQNPDAPWVLDRSELVRRLSTLPEKDFPYTTRYAAELTAGEGHQRFDFALNLLLNSLDSSRT